MFLDIHTEQRIIQSRISRVAILRNPNIKYVEIKVAYKDLINFPSILNYESLLFPETYCIEPRATNSSSLGSTDISSPQSLQNQTVTDATDCVKSPWDKVPARSATSSEAV